MQGRAIEHKGISGRTARAVVAAVIFSGMATACASTGRADQPALSKHVPFALLPEIAAGDAGWCVAQPNGFVCKNTPTSQPVVVESWVGSSPPPVFSGFAVTRSDVAAVLVDGRRIWTRTEVGLPEGLRVVDTEIRAPEAEVQSDAHPHFVALDDAGRRISRHQQSKALLVELPTASASSARGPWSCEVAAEGAPGLQMKQATVVPRIRPVVGVVGDPFLSCASTTYTYMQTRVVASLLLDAAHPGARPKALPSMRPVSGHPGVFEAPGLEGAMAARRVNGGWLVVEGGGELRWRLMLLAHVHGSVSL
jgi:hypothetical protein